MASTAAIGSSNDLVIKLDAHGRQLAARRAYRHLVIVPGALPVFAVHFNDRQLDAVFFHRSVGPARATQPVRPANLEPDQIVRVIDDAHLVGFRVADTHR